MKLKIENWRKIGPIVFLIIVGLIVFNTDVSNETKLGATVMLILLGFYFFDDSAHKQIRGNILSDEEKAKRENPFIK